MCLEMQIQMILYDNDDRVLLQDYCRKKKNFVFESCRLFESREF